MSEQEKPFTITYASVNEVNAGYVSFNCICGTPLHITRRTPESKVSGTFCQQCDECWWVRWSVGELHRGGFTQEEEPMSERDTHFEGFAKLLVADLLKQGFLTPVYGVMPYTLIARAGYDLAYHVVGETVGGSESTMEHFVAGVPDMTAWPQREQEGL